MPDDESINNEQPHGENPAEEQQNTHEERIDEQPHGENPAEEQQMSAEEIINYLRNGHEQLDLGDGIRLMRIGSEPKFVQYGFCYDESINQYKFGDGIHYEVHNAKKLYICLDDERHNFDRLSENLKKVVDDHKTEFEIIPPRRGDKLRIAVKNPKMTIDGVIEGLRALYDHFENIGMNYHEEAKMQENEIKDLVLNNFQLILTGAPGTGKTYTAEKIVAPQIADPANIQKVQFHPNYDYSDFVTGIKPKLTDGDSKQIYFEWEDGIFKRFSDRALKAYIEAKEENKDIPKFVFIIDEINRADLSRVFGELFSCLEEDYRFRYDNEKGNDIKYKFDDGTKTIKGTGTSIVLPSGDNFVIPENLYIIATMNDIDRSVESMDFALRRRFAWKEITASDSVHIIDEKVKKYQDAVKKAMNDVNGIIHDKLGPAYELGGAIFAKAQKYVENASKQDVGKALWDNHIYNIVNEYLRGRSKRKEILSEIQKKYNASFGLVVNQQNEDNAAAQE